jgi:DNA (cytosine-5)-methyltransferase 1
MMRLPIEQRKVSVSAPAWAPQYVAADLFCGVGGLSLGFTMTRRFSVAFGCDIAPAATEAFQLNHALNGVTPVAYTGDIREMNVNVMVEALASRGVSNPGELGCLIGGPPCEGFSQNRSLNSGGKPGRRVSARVDKFIDDPRNWLFKWFVEIAGTLQPKVVLIENVPDLVRHREGQTIAEILEALADSGYMATARVLNAANFGVPQLRRRMFLLAQRISDFEETGIRLKFPEPTHQPYPLGHGDLDVEPTWLPGDAGYWTTVREAIGDLPEAIVRGSAKERAYEYPAATLTALRRFLRSPDGMPPANHLARPLGANGLAKVHRRDVETPEEADRNGRRDHYYYSYKRLRWAEPARTITKFVYHVGSGMFAHPEADRALTMREAARLQTFPDWFSFPTERIRETSGLIGGAVPPLLAMRLAQQVSSYLDAVAYAKLDAFDRSRLRPQVSDAVVRRLEREEWSSSRERHEPLRLPFAS